jgi:hypothetical protein
VALALAGAAAIALWSGEWAPLGHVNRDVANALYVGRRILHGDLLYVDWHYYVTPPIVQLSAGACFVAELVGLRPQTAFHLLVIATAALGVAVIHGARLERDARRVVTLAYLGVLVAAGPVSGDFGQREHLFALLFVPYLIWRISRGEVGAPLLLLAFGLGFASMIKPHFLAGVALCEAFFLRERRGRLALWACLGAGALAPFAILALEPRAFRAMLERMVPYHLGSSYGAYASAPSRFLWHPRHLGLLALAAPALAAGAWAVATGRLERRVALPALCVALLFYLGIWQQRMFFPYHFLPFQAVAWVFLFFAAFRIAAGRPAGTGRRVAIALVALLPVAAIARGLASMAELAAQRPPLVVRALAQALGPRGRLLLVSPTVEGAVFTFALRRDVEIVGPWTSNYTLPELLALEDPEARERAVRGYFEPLAERIRAERPDLVLFSPSTQALPRGRTLHDVIARELRLFPIPGYRMAGQTPDGWILYARWEVGPPGPAGRGER